MPVPSSLARRSLLTAGLALSVSLATAVPVQAGPAGQPVSRTTAPVLLGQATIPTGTQFQGTTVGGLSGTAYDAGRDVYYALSDDRSQLSPARFYTLDIDLSDGALDQGEVTVLAVTTLRGEDGQTFPALSLDPEGLALTRSGTLLIVSEGDANARIAPFVREFSLAGAQVRSFPVPDYYSPTGTSGVRNNLAFESAGLTPQGQFLFTATENALVQDGPAATVTTSSPARILRYDSRSGQLGKEFVYEVDAVPNAPVPATAFATNGLVELLPLGPTRLLALERAFSTGVGNSVRLYLVDLAGATDVSGRDRLPTALSGIRTAEKTLLLDLDTLGVTLDNLEALAFGPVLPDGRQSLVITSDNNFSTRQTTQFLAFAI